MEQTELGTTVYRTQAAAACSRVGTLSDIDLGNGEYTRVSPNGVSGGVLHQYCTGVGWPSESPTIAAAGFSTSHATQVVPLLNTITTGWNSNVSRLTSPKGLIVVSTVGP
jgi:hypothetical protein